MKIDEGSQEAKDASYHLHGFTNAKTHLDVGPVIIDRAEGVHIFDSAGRKYLEAVAGLWSVAVGFSEQRLVDAATAQLKRLPFYHTFFHRASGPLVDLAEKLVKIAPVEMSKVFFTNSGSEANDTAIKLIRYRSNALGLVTKKKLIARERAYHGVTIGAGSLTGLAMVHRSFDLPIPGILRVGSPHHRKDATPGESEEDFASRRAKELEELIISEGPETIAAFFAEPVLGAGGAVTPPRTYWEKIQAVLRKYDVLLVADEVVSGFGRTGNMFGSQTYDIRPDLMILSKGLSSSYQPISAVVMNDRVFTPIAEEANRVGVFGHGFTASGHPVAAAVALENIRVIEDRQLVAHARNVGERLLRGLRRHEGHPLVDEVRGVGLLAAVELTPKNLPQRDAYTVGDLGGRVVREMFNEGVIVRQMVDAVGFCPPLIISAEQIDEVLGAFDRALQRVARTQLP